MTLLQNDRVPSPAQETPPANHASSRRPFLAYLPLAVAVFLILIPHPSFIIMVASYYLKSLRSPAAFWTRLLALNLLTILVLSSLLACVIRDPGSVVPMSSCKPVATETDREETHAALLEDEDHFLDVDDLQGEGRWCRRCELHRPERAHHCSTCDRCVLKMDHHCPWLGGKCVGYRTYPSFLHFIFMATVLAAYIAGVALSVLVHLISHPYLTDPQVTPLHSLFLSLLGAIFTMTMGSFFFYHFYLVSTNQTTIENLSPFFLLRYLPASPRSAGEVSPPSRVGDGPFAYPPFTPPPEPSPPPPLSPQDRAKIFTTPTDPPRSGHSPDSSSPTTNSYPPLATPPYASNSSVSPYWDQPLEEHMLSTAQRRIVKHAHGSLRPYDVGFRANWAQVFGTSRRGWVQWVYLVLWGGAPCGDGRTFAHGPGIQVELERLARRLDDVRRMEGRGRPGISRR